jgi:acetyl esterase
LCRRLCNVTPAVVVNLDYRLAPEHPFPAALEDVGEALEWILRHASAYGGDSGRLTVMGTSAGGNLAAACCLRARDLGGPPITLQVLGYPVTDSSMSGASYHTVSGYVLSEDQMRWFWRQYVPDAAELTDPLASPLNATSLAGLPPAMVVTAEFDPLRDEGELYARRLAEAGVRTELRRYAGQVHGFLGMLTITDDAGLAITAIGARIAESAAPRQESAGGRASVGH